MKKLFVQSRPWLFTLIAILLNLLSGHIGDGRLMQLSFLSSALALLFAFLIQGGNRYLKQFLKIVNGLYVFLVGSVYLLVLWISYNDALPDYW